MQQKSLPCHCTSSQHYKDQMVGIGFFSISEVVELIFYEK